MSCKHPSGYKCISCAPELWVPTELMTKRTSQRLKEELVERYLRAKRKYYEPEHPEATEADEVPDGQFDGWENAIRRQWPDHPCLGLVGWEDEYMEYVKA